MCLPHAVPPRPEGRTRRHEREAEMRWTLAASVRRMMLRTDGEGVWSWHPWAGAKSAGDDLQATVTMRSRTPGRARTTPLTPLRREGRVAPVEPVVTHSCAFTTAHEAAGATSTRSSLRPRSFEGHWCRITRAKRAAGTRSCGFVLVAAHPSRRPPAAGSSG
jgi:hypothetical protein